MSQLKEMNGKQYMTAKVVMLANKNELSYQTYYKLQSGETMPVVKINQLILNKDTNKLSLNKNNAWSITCDLNGEHDSLFTQHLYITSIEEIKNGDCVYDRMSKCVIKNWSFAGLARPIFEFDKIIATTDSSLLLPIPESLDMYPMSYTRKQYPQPSIEFIEEFIKAFNSGKTIVDVLVEVGEKLYEHTSVNCGYMYRPLKLKNNTISIKIESNIIEQTEEDLEEKCKLLTEAFKVSTGQFIDMYQEIIKLRKMNAILQSGIDDSINDLSTKHSNCVMAIGYLKNAKEESATIKVQYDNEIIKMRAERNKN